MTEMNRERVISFCGIFTYNSRDWNFTHYLVYISHLFIRKIKYVIRGNVIRRAVRRRNVFSGNYPFEELCFGELFAGEMFVRELSVGAVSLGKCSRTLSTNVHCTSIISMVHIERFDLILFENLQWNQKFFTKLHWPLIFLILMCNIFPNLSWKFCPFSKIRKKISVVQYSHFIQMLLTWDKIFCSCFETEVELSTILSIFWHQLQNFTFLP